jgi:DNA polymerase type B, organellar and viral
LSISKKTGKFVNDYFRHGSAGKEFKIAGFDLETDGLGGKVLMATYFREGDNRATFIRTGDIIGKLVAVIRVGSQFIWYAHNAAYDWRYLLDVFRDHSSRCRFNLRNDNSLFSIRLSLASDLDPDDHIQEKEKYVVMRDSLAIWPGTLRELAATFCPDYPKGEIDFEGGERFDPYKQEHIDYALRDSEILVYGLRAFDNIIYEKYGVHLSGTIASTAMRAWQRMLGKEERYFNPKSQEEFIRSAYYGGIVFLNRTDILTNLKTYDLSSSYPHQMREHGVPYGQITGTSKIIPGVPGIYEVTVKAPDNLLIPILPYRDNSKKIPAVLWPRGVFRTSVTSMEIAFALEHGYELLEVHKGIIFEKIIYPFKQFVDRAESIRMQFKGTASEKVAKLIQNALYGKFCARRERRELLTWDEVKDNPLDCVPWDDDGNFYVRKSKIEDIAVLPQWGVWITANARLHVLRTCYDVLGVENVYYGDTDSLTTSGTLPTAKAYGSWQLEKSWKRFRAIAPKVYVGQLDGAHKLQGKDYADGDWYGAVKGIPWKKVGPYVFETIFEHDICEVELSYLPSFLVTMKGGDGILKSIVRKSTDVENSRNWSRDGDQIRARYLPGSEALAVNGGD